MGPLCQPFLIGGKRSSLFQKPCVCKCRWVRPWICSQDLFVSLGVSKREIKMMPRMITGWFTPLPWIAALIKFLPRSKVSTPIARFFGPFCSVTTLQFCGALWSSANCKAVPRLIEDTGVSWSPDFFEGSSLSHNGRGILIGTKPPTRSNSVEFLNQDHQGTGGKNKLSFINCRTPNNPHLQVPQVTRLIVTGTHSGCI